MKKIKLVTKDKTIPVVIGSRILTGSLIKKHIDGRDIVIITNTTIKKLYLEKILSCVKSYNVKILSLPDGERYKNAKTFMRIHDFLLSNNFDRNLSIIALGGGVIGDLVGFVASTFMRGVKLIHIPTTLLSQVDSSVGGKTAINIPQGKNLVGAFYNPKCVLISIQYLKTLTEDEYKSGLGEVIKYSFIGNKALKKLIEDKSKQIIERKESTLKIVIEQSIKTKAKIVTKDEKESGIRAILNFGHTFGHAIEAYKKYNNITHGAAITLGMIIASKLSLYEGHIKDSQLKKVLDIIDLLELESDYSKYNYAKLKPFMAKDKKISSGKLNLVMIDKNFNGFLTSKYDVKNIKKVLG